MLTKEAQYGFFTEDEDIYVNGKIQWEKRKKPYKAILKSKEEMP